MTKLHSRLKSQLRKKINDAPIPQEWQSLIDVVDEAYKKNDEDRALLESSLENGAQELSRAHDQILKAWEIASGIGSKTNVKDLLSFVADAAVELEGISFVSATKVDKTGQHVTTYFSALKNRDTIKKLKSLGFDLNTQLRQSPDSNNVLFPVSKSKMMMEYIAHPKITVHTRLADLVQGIFPAKVFDRIQKMFKLTKFILVPIMIDGKEYFTLTFFLDAEVSQKILEMIATQCSLAIKNLLLLESLQKRNQEIDAAKNQLEHTLEQLSTSEERLRTTYEAVSEGIVVTDANHIITDVNSSALKMNGYSDKKELIGQSASVLSEPGYAERFQNLVKRNNDSPVEFNSKLRKKDGQTFDAELSLAAVKDAAGQIKSFVTTARDITRRLNDERKLKESEQKYFNLVENSNDAIIIMQDMELKFSSSHITKLTGYKPDEFRDKPLLDFLATSCRNKIAEMLTAKGQGVPLPPRIELDILTKDNETVPVELNISFIEYEGKPADMAVIRNVSERKNTEMALKMSEQNFRNSMDDSPLGIMIYDHNSRLVYANNAILEMYGFRDIEEFKKTSVKRRSTEKTYAAFLARQEKLRQGDINPATFEMDIIRKDGTVRTLQCYRKTVLWEGKQHQQAICQDVTEQKKAETGLREFNQQLQAIIQDSPIGIMIADRDGYVQTWNPACQRIYGWTADEVIGKFTPWVSADKAEESRSIRERVLAGETIIGMELLRFRKDGSPINISISNAALKNERGIPDRILCIVEDITQRKKDEAELREFNQQMQAIINTSPIGIHIADKNGLIQIWNPVCERIYGWKAEEIIGKFPPYITPDKLEENEDIRKRVIAGETIVGREIKRVRKDGTPIDISVSNAVLKNKQGIPDRILCLVEDITQRKQDEAKLREFNQQMQALINASPIGILIADKDNCVQTFNPACERIFGWTAEEVIGKFTRWLPSDKFEESRNIKERAFAGETIRGMELSRVRKDGTPITISVSNAALKNEQGIPDRILSMIEDITQRKKDEAELREFNQQLQLIIDASPNGIQIIDKDNNVRVWNPACEVIFGWTADEVIGKPSPFIPPEKQSESDQLRQRVRRGEILKCVELERRRKDGSTIYCEMSAAPIRNEQGDVDRIVTILEDITQRKKAESELREFNQQMQALLNASPVGIQITDKDVHIETWNPACEQIFGWKAEEVIGKDLPYVPLQDAKESQQRAQRIFTGETFKNVQVERRRKDGSKIIVELSCAPLSNTEGKYNRALTIIEDATERNLAEQLTRIRLSLLEYAATHTLRELLQKTLDEVGEITESPLGFFHFVEEDQKTISLRAWSTRTINEFCHAEGYDTHYSIEQAGIWADSVRERQPVIHDDFQSIPGKKGFPEGHATILREMTIPIIRGEKVVALMGIGNKKLKYTEQDLKVASFLADVAWEIARRKSIEEEMKHQQELIDRVIASTPSAVLVTGKDTRIILANETFYSLFNKNKGEIETKTISEIIPAQEVQHAISTAQIEKTPTSVEFSLSIGEKELILFASIMAMSEGETLITMTDITEVRETQQRLYLTDRLASVGEMAAGVAHEINNPLTSVVMLSQMLLENAQTEETRQDLRAIYAEAKRASTIIKNLLTFARKHDAQMQPTQLNTVIEDVLKLRSYEHKVNSIKVITHFNAALPEIVVDRFQLQQVFLNIILNAEQSMMSEHKEGTMTITTAVRSNVVKISVSDTGPGIPPENMGKLFTPFFTTKEVGKGTGLGLSICYGIVTSHGGKIYAQNNPNGGATFIVELPLNNKE